MDRDLELPETLPAPRIKRVRPRVTLIWLVPLIAILVGLGLAVQAIRDRGPEVTLQFSLAEGLEANKTRVKFKDVEIGTVKAIALHPDRKSVRVTVQMDRQAEDLLVEDTRFWVVRPRVAAGGISGLATLLSGSYIALDPGKSETSRRDFVGLEVPPLVTSDTPGHHFSLAADDIGSLDIGAPVYFRRVQVGRVVNYAMREDGKGVDIRIFISAPYDKFVRQSSRFWHASGIDVSLDANGVKVDMQSLLSLALGGIAFASVDGDDDEPAPGAEADTRFSLYADQVSAMRVPDTEVHKFMLSFGESVRGLAVGAPVDFKGLVAGEVSRIDLSFDEKTTTYATQVEINLYPERLAGKIRSPAGRRLDTKVSRDVLDRMVAKGFRAQLRTGNILTGQRYVALDFFPDSKLARVDWQRRVPELPTQTGTFDSVQEQLLAIVGSLRQTLQHVDQLVVRLDGEIAPDLAATLRDARTTLGNVDKLLGSADKTLLSADKMLLSADQALVSDAPLQLEMRETLREVSKAAAAVRNLADMLERQPEALITGKKDSR